jgi:hypothetical protein
MVADHGSTILGREAAEMGEEAAQRVAAEGATATNIVMESVMRLEAKVDALLRRDRMQLQLSRPAKKTAEVAGDDGLAESVEEAIKQGRPVKGKLIKWLEEKGYGFAHADGKEVFLYKNAIRVRDRIRVGSQVALRILADPAHGPGKIRASEAWDIDDWKAEVAMQRSAEAANSVRRAAEAAEEAAEEAMAKALTARVIKGPLQMWPPGLRHQEEEERPGEKNMITAPLFKYPGEAAAGEKKAEKGGTAEMATQTDCKCRAAPWPEVRVKIAKEEVEKLLATSGRLAINELAKVMKSKWLVENFEIVGEAAKGEMLVKVQSAVARTLKKKPNRWPRLEDEATSAVELARRMKANSVVSLFGSNAAKLDDNILSELLLSRANCRRFMGDLKGEQEDRKEAREGGGGGGLFGQKVAEELSRPKSCREVESTEGGGGLFGFSPARAWATNSHNVFERSVDKTVELNVIEAPTEVENYIISSEDSEEEGGDVEETVNNDSEAMWRVQRTEEEEKIIAEVSKKLRKQVKASGVILGEEAVEALGGMAPTAAEDLLRKVAEALRNPSAYIVQAVKDQEEYDDGHGAENDVAEKGDVTAPEAEEEWPEQREEEWGEARWNANREEEREEAGHGGDDEWPEEPPDEAWDDEEWGEDWAEEW